MGGRWEVSGRMGRVCLGIRVRVRICTPPPPPPTRASAASLLPRTLTPPHDNTRMARQEIRGRRARASLAAQPLSECGTCTMRAASCLSYTHAVQRRVRQSQCKHTRVHRRRACRTQCSGHAAPRPSVAVQTRVLGSMHTVWERARAVSCACRLQCCARALYTCTCRHMHMYM
jgi:hypothetical protein